MKHLVKVRDRGLNTHQLEITHAGTAKDAVAFALKTVVGSELLSVEPPDPVEQTPDAAPVPVADTPAEVVKHE